MLKITTYGKRRGFPIPRLATLKFGFYINVSADNKNLSKKKRFTPFFNNKFIKFIRISVSALSFVIEQTFSPFYGRIL